jgi:hypothetical protein
MDTLDMDMDMDINTIHITSVQPPRLVGTCTSKPFAISNQSVHEVLGLGRHLGVQLCFGMMTRRLLLGFVWDVLKGRPWD